MYQLIIYIPESHCDDVKSAMFKAGAGRYERYEQCAWQVRGQGQFRPLSGSKPFIGNQNEVTTVEEFRVEMICDDHSLNDAIEAMLEAHPYEEPAYTILKHQQLR